MLCAAIAGFATVVHTGSDSLGLLAGFAAGALLASMLGVLVIWLNTNPYATGLALSLFGAGLSAFLGTPYVQAKLPERLQFSVPGLSDLPWVGPALFQHHPMGWCWNKAGPTQGRSDSPGTLNCSRSGNLA